LAIYQFDELFWSVGSKVSRAPALVSQFLVFLVQRNHVHDSWQIPGFTLLIKQIALVV
jgi:hypothetical protein